MINSTINTTSCLRFCSRALTGGLLAFLTSTAFGAGVGAGDFNGESYDAAANYKNEIAACKNESGKSNRASCMAEAKKTLSESQRGGNSAQQTLSRNAMERCNVLKGDKRRDCESRSNGVGRVDGSVASGGILRETVTIVPAK